MAATEDFDREYTRQVQLGGALNTHQPRRFVFRREPVVDRCSARLGVHERVFSLSPL